MPILAVRAQFMECGELSPHSPAGDLSPANARELAHSQSADQSAHSKSATLADLYDPIAMPPKLLKAHTELDRAVHLCYRKDPFPSDRHRVEYLFQLYEQLTAPLLPVSKKRLSLVISYQW